MAPVGRPPSTKTLVDRQLGRNRPRPFLGNSFHVPNHSGDHSAGTTSTPINDTDIANKKYVDDLTTDHPHQDVRTTATPTFEGASMNSNKVTSVLDPTAAQDGATKAYVDNATTPVECPANSIVTITGTLDAGTVTDVQIKNDGNTYDVSEVTGVPGFDIQVTFTDVTNFNSVKTHNHYNGSLQHTVLLQLFNKNTTDWDTIGIVPTSVAQQELNISDIDDLNYIDNGTVIVRYNHVTTGNVAHDLFIDYCSIWNSFGGGAAATLWEEDNNEARLKNPVPISMQDKQINDVLDPTENQDAATKKYVDLDNPVHRHSSLMASDGSPDPALSVDISGNVGIGTTSPASKLHVDGKLTLKDPATSASNEVIDFTNGYSVYSDDAGAGGNNTRLWFDALDGGEMVFGPRSGSAWLGNMRLRSDNISFETTTGGSATLKIIENGNIGIGIASPTAKLDIDGRLRARNGRQPAGSIHATSPTENTVFDAIAPSIPNTNDEIIVSGVINKNKVVSKATRTSATVITFSGVEDGAEWRLITKTVTDGSAASFEDTSIAW